MCLYVRDLFLHQLHIFSSIASDNFRWMTVNMLQYRYAIYCSFLRYFILGGLLFSFSVSFSSFFSITLFCVQICSTDWLAEAGVNNDASRDECSICWNDETVTVKKLMKLAKSLRVSIVINNHFSIFKSSFKTADLFIECQIDCVLHKLRIMLSIAIQLTAKK